jgi:hypothetical protein
MKLVQKILLIVSFLHMMVVGRRLKFHRKKRRSHDEVDLPIIAHATAYDEIYNNKRFENFFSTFEHIFEEGGHNYKVTVGVTKDPLPGESDHHPSGRQPRALIVVFRGTANLDNVFKDMKYSQEDFGNIDRCQGCLVHGGIWEAYTKLKQKLLEKLTDLLSQYRSRTDIHIHHVIFTGHSLGGAMANLAAYNFCHRRNEAQRDPNNALFNMFNVETVSLITFGSPRVGNTAFKQHMETQLGLRYNFRVIYGNDPITSAPPRIIGEVIGDLKYEFEHAGTEIRYAIGNFEDPHRANDTRDTCGNQTFKFVDIVRGLMDIGDHTQYKRINYRKLWQEITK